MAKMSYFILFLLIASCFRLEVEAEELIKNYAKPTRKFLQDEILIKVFGIKDDHGENACAHTNAGCFRDKCCSGCECLRFLLRCVGTG
ncbi:unnamed protein product [Coffea canephora]|uniref:DH200=94 genomic scaffold, scaffold_1148 n=1 Tax=Coffea canephora TaxID=49390 RepID=A0A068VIG6_COFCA|nr:unnamed protein product [Coffea canephora]